MRKVIAIAILAAVVAAGVIVYRWANGANAATNGSAQAVPGGGGGMQGGPGGRGGQFARLDMPVELAAASRANVAAYITVVGNLIGAATVEVAAKVNGRLDSVDVRLGDAVGRGQKLAQVEDRELREQVKQAEAAYEVANASVRQREADAKFAETSLERARNLFNRQLLPKQTLDDADARYQAAVAQLDLARAQFQQSRSRLEELRLNLANTIVRSPVDGFVGKRFFDPGAFVSSNNPVVSVVDIHFVRLVVNLVEKDLKQISVGNVGQVEVDAYPGEEFKGRLARIAPVLDPSTRTAEMEIEIPNKDARLKPGMYARVRLTTSEKAGALVVPRTSIVEVEGKSGVFVAAENTARFKPVEIGIQQDDLIEVVNGVQEGEQVITTGSGALKDGDRIVRAGQQQQQPDAGRGSQGGGRRGSSGGRGPGAGSPPATR
jgi:RND family efflux transporter MFP subunit